MDYKTISIICQIRQKITEVETLLADLDTKDNVSRLLRIYDECSTGGSFKRAEFKRKYGQSLGDAINSFSSGEIDSLKDKVGHNSGIYRIALKRQKYLKESPWEV